MRHFLIPAVAVFFFCACSTPPIMKAARRGDAAGVRALLKQGANPDQYGKPITLDNPGMRINAMGGAIQKKNHDVIKALLDGGSDPNRPVWMAGIRPTPLYIAAGGGDVTAARMLLDAGADPNLGGERTLRVPLYWAVKSRSLELVRLLLDRGAARDARAIVTAQEEGLSSILQLLNSGALNPKKRVNNQAAKALLDSKMAKIRTHTEAGDKAKKAGNNSAALKNYVAALGEAPPGAEIERELRMKIIRFVRSMKKPPSVSEDAKHHALRAQSFLKRAKSEAGYKKAEEELEAAIRIAPWWGDAYFNLGLVQEKLKDYKTAIESLKLYIAAAPNAPDIGKIKKKIVDLEVAQELAQ